jgi:hypothetical protein
LQTLLGIYTVVSECSDPVIDRIAEDAHVANDTISRRNGNGWENQVSYDHTAT